MFQVDIMLSDIELLTIITWLLLVVVLFICTYIWYWNVYILTLYLLLITFNLLYSFTIYRTHFFQYYLLIASLDKSTILKNVSRNWNEAHSKWNLLYFKLFYVSTFVISYILFSFFFSFLFSAWLLTPSYFGYFVNI